MDRHIADALKWKQPRFTTRDDMDVKAACAQTRRQLLQLPLGAAHMWQVTLYQHSNAFHSVRTFSSEASGE